MAEPTRFNFDTQQRSVGTAPSRRRRTWIWIALSLVLHGVIVFFAFSGAARGGRAELLGTLEVAVVGPVSAGRPDGESTAADAKPAEKPPAPLVRPAQLKKAPPTKPRPGQGREPPRPKPLPQGADAAPLRQPAATTARNEGFAATASGSGAAAKPRPRRRLPRRGKAPPGQTAALGSPKGEDRLGNSDGDVPMA
ncbi:MAG: hypothetical protein KIT16_11085 [Rhodospirillaceae bacterium]|nr:hypothetical protein [Rhodospirillaceae bacterium]